MPKFIGVLLKREIVVVPKSELSVFFLQLI